MAIKFDPILGGLRQKEDPSEINAVSSLVTLEPTGFDHPENVVVSYNASTLKITLSGTGWKAYWRGQEVTALVTGWESVAHDAAAGTYFLQYNGSTFTWGTTVWDFDGLQIAIAYNTTTPFGLREPHGLMPHQTHKTLHETLGTYLESGGGLGDFTLASTTEAHRRPDVSETKLVDEDLPSTLAALTSKAYTWFHLTSTATVNLTVDSTEILSVTGDRPNYNQFTGGAWTQTEFPVNAYGKVFVLAVPVTADAASQKMRYLFIQPQQVSTNITTARGISVNSLNLGALSAAVPEFTFIGEILVRYAASNWTLIETNKLVGTKVSQVAISSITPAGIGAAPALLTKTVEIAVLDWAGTTAAKVVDDVLPASLLWISPVPASYDAYTVANIRATAQGTDSITFGCVNVPSVAVNVNVIIGSV